MRKTTKLYKCPKCGLVSAIDTVGVSDHKSQCKRCQSAAFHRCLEFEAVTGTISRRTRFPVLRTRLHVFYDEETLSKLVIEYGVTPKIKPLQSHRFKNSPPVTSGEIWLETERLYDNSWHVAFDSPNNSYMHLVEFCAVYAQMGSDFCYGYIIEPTEEMQSARAGTRYCGQCGESAAPGAAFCQTCLYEKPFSFKRCQHALLRRNGQSVLLDQKAYISAVLMVLKKRLSETAALNADTPSLRGKLQAMPEAAAPLFSYLSISPGSCEWLNDATHALENDMSTVAILREHITELERVLLDEQQNWQHSA